MLPTCRPHDLLISLAFSMMAGCFWLVVTAEFIGSENEGGEKFMRLFWLGFAVGVLSAFAFAWGYQRFKYGRELSLRVTCSSNLIAASRVLLSYSGRHQGEFPLSLDEAKSEFQAYPDPDARGGCPKARDEFPPNEGWRSYLYIPPRKDAPDDTPILLCWRHPELIAVTKNGALKRWHK